MNVHDDEKAEGADSGIPALEWIMAALGALLVLGAIGYMLLQARTLRGEPPVVRVTVDSILPSAGGWLVVFEAENSGGGTAAGLQVVGTLTRAGSPPEESQVTLDYVPARSTRSGGLFFTADPGSGELVVRPAGYQEP
jgi:uncharacterized protein (TIGR02588 family)